MVTPLPGSSPLTIAVPVSQLQALIREARKAKSPQISWNESAQVMHQRAHQARGESLNIIETELETILGPDHTPL